MEKMFSPYRIGSKTAKNRIIRSATNDHLGNPDGTVSDAEIEMMERIRDWFVAAAKRAQEAGFDGVQVHLAHWYLLQAVMNLDINKRTDKYGGAPENCLRLPLEIVEGIRKESGPNFILMVKMNAHNTLSDEDDSKLLAYYASCLLEAGVDMVELSGVDFNRRDRKAELYYLEEARCLKESHPEIVMSLVGGIFSKEAIEKALEVTEFASLARTLLTQPDFITRIKAGEEQKSRCIHCNKCFEIFATKYERCVFGPVLPKLEETFSNYTS